MKKILFTLLIFIGTLSETIAQNNSFDKSLTDLTSTLIEKLQSQKQKKMAVWDLSDLNGQVSTIGKYIAEDISINLSGKFQIANRNQLNIIMKENQLGTNGTIDLTAMKKLKSIANLDIIITGTITVFENNIKITLQAIDSGANIIAATKGEIVINDEIKQLLDRKIEQPQPVTIKGSNNSAIDKVNTTNNEIGGECKEGVYGEYILNNATKSYIEISLDLISADDASQASNRTRIGVLPTIKIEPEQSKTLYRMASGIWSYTIRYYAHQNDFNWANSTNGQIKVETCKSKTFEIKL